MCRRDRNGHQYKLMGAAESPSRTYFQETMAASEETMGAKEILVIFLQKQTFAGGKKKRIQELGLDTPADK